MPGYLLLRSNKESGPFALQELITLGLKPYDLVWVEGKSAAWRYPGEIAELKPYAPVMEEQPYDRFYKKKNQQVNTDETVTTEKNVKTIGADTTQSIADTTVLGPDNGRQIPDTNPHKRIFVTLPAEVERVRSLAESTKLDPVETPVETVVAVNKIKLPPEPEAKYFKNTVPESVVLEEKYSMPLDDIKQLYIDNVLKQTKKKGARFKLGSNLMMFVAVAGFFALVIVIGALISDRKGKIGVLFQPAAQQDAFIQQKADDVSDEKSTDALPEKQTDKRQVSLPIVEKQEQNKQREPFVLSDSQPVKMPVARDKASQKPVQYNNEPAVISLPSSTTETDVTVITVPPTVQTNGSIGSNEQVLSQTAGNAPRSEQAVLTTASYPAAPDPEKTGTKKKIKKLVVIDKVNYKTGLLGGVKNISVSLSNHSNYKMDLVIVDVDYLKANDNTTKTERLYFKNMLPDAVLTLEAPPGQGSKIDCRITLISSKELDYLYATIN
jgi:hypothetical protein